MLKLGNYLLKSNNSICHRLLNSGLSNGFNKVRHESSSYDGDGKISAEVMNNDLEYGLMIEAYNESGFKLNNKFNVIGPMIVFPRTVLAWNINTVEDITENSLRLFTLMEPKPELLIIGTGDEQVTLNLIDRIHKILKPYNLAFEMLKTDRAAGVFNFLNADSRYVVGAFLPPKKDTPDELRFFIQQKRTIAIYGQKEPNFEKKVLPDSPSTTTSLKQK